MANQERTISLLTQAAGITRIQARTERNPKRADPLRRLRIAKILEKFSAACKDHAADLIAEDARVLASAKAHFSGPAMDRIIASLTKE